MRVILMHIINVPRFSWCRDLKAYFANFTPLDKILRINVAEMETCKHAWSQLRINEHKEVRAQINHQ